MKRLILPILFAVASPAADSRLAPSIDAFTTSCYQKLAQGDANLILSPFNIATALSMALAGARGQTAQEIQAVLHLHHDPAYNADLAALLAALNKAGNTPGNELHTANSLWVQKGFAIQPAFEDTLRLNYGASPTPLDFIANADAARTRINRWAEKQTNDKIQNLFPPGSLDAQTRLVLASAIYFYGKWQAPFTASRTQPAPFTLSDGATAQASFMNQTGHFGYTETQSAQILELRYAGTGMAFDVVLPKTAMGLAALDQSLTPETVAAWTAALTSKEVAVSLPKFRVESQFSLGKTLSAMGMPTAFTSHADFSGISPQLAISVVVHKAFVEVAEQGVEAAASTGIAIHATAVRRAEPPIVFRADHPFLFLIRDTATGVVLFIGRLMHP